MYCIDPNLENHNVATRNTVQKTKSTVITRSIQVNQYTSNKQEHNVQNSCAEVGISKGLETISAMFAIEFRKKFTILFVTQWRRVMQGAFSRFLKHIDLLGRKAVFFSLVFLFFCA